MRGISKIYRESFWTKKSLETIGFKAFYGKLHPLRYHLILCF